jgi:hypothetical protein
MARPRTSVVFVVPADRHVSIEQLAALLPHPADRAVEFVVSLNEPDLARELQRRRRNLRCICACAGAGTPALREAGVREATGNIVVVVEVTEAVEAQWQLGRPADMPIRASLGSP